MKYLFIPNLIFTISPFKIMKKSIVSVYHFSGTLTTHKEKICSNVDISQDLNVDFQFCYRKITIIESLKRHERERYPDEPEGRTLQSSVTRWLWFSSKSDKNHLKLDGSQRAQISAEKLIFKLWFVEREATCIVKWLKTERTCPISS